jgi:hypothetical protein
MTNDSRRDDLINDMEREIRRTVSRQAPRLEAMPSYVTHAEEVDDVGRLSAEAIAMSFETSAKRIEQMGRALIESTRECEQETLRLVKELERVRTENEQAVEKCQETAHAYRAQAKELFEKIQERSTNAARVREACDAMIDQLK